MLNQDFKEMLQYSLDERVEFLPVGGYALAAHGYPRATKDLDIWVLPNLNNSDKVYKFGAPMDTIKPDDFGQKGIILQLGIPPNRIDIITQADGVNFDACKANATVLKIEGLDIPIISKQDLIRNKRASGRPQDIVDADALDND